MVRGDLVLSGVQIKIVLSSTVIQGFHGGDGKEFKGKWTLNGLLVDGKKYSHLNQFWDLSHGKFSFYILISLENGLVQKILDYLFNSGEKTA